MFFNTGLCRRVYLRNLRVRATELGGTKHIYEVTAGGKRNAEVKR